MNIDECIFCKIVKKEIRGPSWSPKTNNNLKINTIKKSFLKNNKKFIEDLPSEQKKYENSTQIFVVPFLTQIMI